MGVKELIAHYVRRCGERQTAPRVSELTAALGMDESTLRRKCKAETGQGAKALMRQAQIELAKELLNETDVNVTEVGYQSGFVTRATFFRVFKLLTGRTPGAYRDFMAKCSSSRGNSDSARF